MNVCSEFERFGGENVRAGEPAAPGDTSLPLLPLGPDGIRRAPPRRTHPDGGEDTRCVWGCQQGKEEKKEEEKRKT